MVTPACPALGLQVNTRGEERPKMLIGLEGAHAFSMSIWGVFGFGHACLAWIVYPALISTVCSGKDAVIDKIKPLVTAAATAVGVRNGHSETSDHVVAVDLSVPKEMGGPGNPATATPEQLF